MAVKCPVCETDNSDDAFECESCGKALAVEADIIEDVPPIDGLEQTLQDPVQADVEIIPDLEQTMIARKDLQVAEEHVPDVQYTQIEEDPEAPVNWVGTGTPIDTGREPDDGVRTPAPQDTGICPWCNAPATGAVCDNCGRRRSRYSVPVATAQAQARPSDDGVLCPACFARVPPGLRCIECGVPFAVVEL